MSCYYHADREFSENEVIPIGQPFENTEILLLKRFRGCAGGKEKSVFGEPVLPTDIMAIRKKRKKHLSESAESVLSGADLPYR